MRFCNLAGIEFDRELWRELARPLSLDGPLKRAVDDDLGIYSGNSLRVTIRPRLARPSGHPAAHYTYGHITVFPCGKCRLGWLTVAYLHELFHAWLHDKNERLYTTWNHCRLADEFADESFLLLGGAIPDNGSCAKFRFGQRNAWRCLPKYRAFAHDLAGRKGPAIKTWDAGMAAESLTSA